MGMIYDNLQRKYGSQRVAELLAIAKIAKEIGATAYVSMGQGAGYDFQAMRDNYKAIPILGFDKRDPLPENIYPGVSYHNETIFVPNEHFTAYVPGQLFTASVTKKIDDFVTAANGPILYYTDNGNKKCELRELLRWVKPGDVVGTHDWGDSPTGLTVMGNRAEVHEGDCGFLYDSGLDTAEFIQPWLKENRCMQKFWVKNLPARPSA
jgi:hypothetical protein